MVEELPTPRSLAIAIIPLGIAATIGNGVFLALSHFLHRSSYMVHASETAFVFAEGSLVAIWIAFGNQPLPVRMFFAVPGMVVTSLLPHSAFSPDVPIGIVLVVVASLPSLTFRIIGWRLTRLTVGPDSADPPTAENPAQFSLRQMFGWTLAVAMVAGLVRIFLRPEDLSPQTIVTLREICAICLFFGTLASATVWAVFNPHRPLMRLLAVVTVTGLPLWIWPFGAMRVSVVALDVCFTGCALLLFRTVGIRLVRLKPKAHLLQAIGPAHTQ